MIFETQDRQQYPPKWLPSGGWVESEYQSGTDRIVKSSRRWITFSALEWITFRALQTTRWIRDNFSKRRQLNQCLVYIFYHAHQEPTLIPSGTCQVPATALARQSLRAFVRANSLEACQCKGIGGDHAYQVIGNVTERCPALAFPEAKFRGAATNRS